MVFIVFGLITIFVIIPDQISSTPSEFGIAPDVFPLTLIWMFTFFCALMVVGRIFSKKPLTDENRKPDIRWGFIIIVSLFLISSFLLVTYFGFIVGGIYTVAVVMLAMGEYRHKLRLIITAVVAPIAITWIFRHVFIILLP